jgi:AcrR family transcriptional regulator
VLTDELPPTRRGRPGHDRDAVLRCAIDLFNCRGYDATSVSDLARALGTVKSAVYHHVPSKERLLELALDEALDELEAVVADSSPDRLRETVRRSVLVLIAHQPAVRLLLAVRGNSEAELRALARRRRLDDRLSALVAAAGLRPDLPADLAGRLLFGAVNSVAGWFRDNGDWSPEVVADALTAMVFDGVGGCDA